MKTIVIFISILFCVTCAFAQTKYYTQTKTFSGNGYVYQCDVFDSQMVILYNKANRWIYVDYKYKDTGKDVTDDQLVDYLQYGNIIVPVIDKYESIVNNAFSAAEKQRVKGHEFMICMYLNSTTGKVDEVSFDFVTFGPYVTIPVSVFRNIEVELKKNIQFTPTAEGKRLTYIQYCWGQEPK